LTTLNKHVDEMNSAILARAEGEERTYNSADFFGPDAAEEQGVYPVEVLNSLTPSGMPPPQLTLRVGAPVVFLRNLNRDQGMMNGTRGVILALRPWSVQVQLTTGPRRGESFVVPRINLTSSDGGDDHIRFIRRQLPLRLAYCMTINKAQGQTFRIAT
jgi:ATP-dependent DNA helicase PIF1